MKALKCLTGFVAVIVIFTLLIFGSPTFILNFYDVSPLSACERYPKLKQLNHGAQGEIWQSIDNTVLKVFYHDKDFESVLKVYEATRNCPGVINLLDSCRNGTESFLVLPSYNINLRKSVILKENYLNMSYLEGWVNQSFHEIIPCLDRNHVQANDIWSHNMMLSKDWTKMTLIDLGEWFVTDKPENRLKFYDFWYQNINKNRNGFFFLGHHRNGYIFLMQKETAAALMKRLGKEKLALARKLKKEREAIENQTPPDHVIMG